MLLVACAVKGDRCRFSRHVVFSYTLRIMSLFTTHPLYALIMLLIPLTTLRREELALLEHFKHVNINYTLNRSAPRRAFLLRWKDFRQARR